ncbi:hypothetical protein ACEQ8H_000774 [Pleosporales sp. CAS-2024a]
MRGSIIAASMALCGSVTAAQHKAHGHGAFHLRRGDPQDDVCTFYTTVYVNPLPSVVPNMTYIAPSPSTSCTEDQHKTSIYTPTVISTTTPAATSSTPCASSIAAPPPPPPAPKTSSTPAPPPAPVSSSAAPAPASSKPADQAKPVLYGQQTAPKTQANGGSGAHVASHGSGGSSGTYGSTGRIVTNGNKWGMTYTPYANSGLCKTAEEIKADIAKIAGLGFTTLRAYSTDCHFNEVVTSCVLHGLKVIYGIFLEAGGASGKGPFSSYANDQLQAIISTAHKESIAMILVGNECMFNNHCEPTDLANYIDYVRNTIRAAGFPADIAVTTTEPVGTWEQKGAAVCDHLDVFVVQIHPYFTATVSADIAGDFVAQQLAQAAKVCPGAAAKGLFVGETGWPNGGDANGAAIASPDAQKIAIKSIMDKVGSQACMFSFQDDGWKAPGALNVEQHFGCADIIV